MYLFTIASTEVQHKLGKCLGEENYPMYTRTIPPTYAQFARMNGYAYINFPYLANDAHNIGNTWMHDNLSHMYVQYSVLQTKRFSFNFPFRCQKLIRMLYERTRFVQNNIFCTFL